MKRLLPVCVVLLLCLPAAEAGDDPKPFTGRVVFEQSAEGDGEGAKMFRGLAASKVTVHFSPDGHRQDEEGGMNEGSVILRNDVLGALFLHHRAKRAERGGGTDLDAQGDAMKSFMPWHYKTDLEPLEETDTICGYAVRKYRVKKSAFVKPDAKAHIWIAEKLQLPKRRYQFEFQARSIISPIPLSIPVPKGAILKAHIVDAGTPVTIVATEVEAGAPDPSLFQKPEAYGGDDFLPKPKQKTAPKKTPMSQAAVDKLAPTLTNGIGMKLVLVKPATFQMGSPEDEPHRHDHETQHEVTLTQAYYIGTTEVTQAQWKAVMGSDSPSKFEGADLPVDNVTWEQAVAFCQKLSEKEAGTYRLPTEAEWEYAARAGETVAYKPMKDFKAWLQAHAWMYWTAKYKTHAVGQLKPNAWGLYDTIGNVAEWTADGYGPFTKDAATDPLGTDSDRKVHRGNGWVSSYDFCRVAQRSAKAKDESKSTIGFRVVREP